LSETDYIFFIVNKGIHILKFIFPIPHTYTTPEDAAVFPAMMKMISESGTSMVFLEVEWQKNHKTNVGNIHGEVFFKFCQDKFYSTQDHVFNVKDKWAEMLRCKMWIEIDKHIMSDTIELLGLLKRN